jgi:type IV pilus assembly protein PilP
MIQICKKISILTIVLCGVVVTLFLFSGCQGEQSPQRKVRATTSAQKEKPVTEPRQAVEEIEEDVAPSVPQISEFRYNPLGRRDPFRSIVVTTQEKGAIPDLPPLQQVEVAEMRLIGIIWGNLGYSAMVQTPDGKGYTIKVGTAVGLHNGIVKRITSQFLTVQEEFTDIFGTTKNRDIVLELHPQEERGE